jgi:C4-dicarboxylate-specific signal transduction histidine kinase
MTDDLKTLSELANSLSIIAVLLYAWTAERRERRELMALLLQSKNDTTAKVEAHLVDIKTHKPPQNSGD